MCNVLFEKGVHCMFPHIVGRDNIVLTPGDDSCHNETLCTMVVVFGLSVVYWWRDRYFFNRGRKFSNVQRQVLFLFYPIWSFLEWSSSLQISRGNWYFIGLGTIGRTLVGHSCSLQRRLCSDVSTGIELFGHTLHQLHVGHLLGAHVLRRDGGL